MDEAEGAGSSEDDSFWVRRFDFGQGLVVKVEEEWGSGLGGTCWDTSILLARCLVNEELFPKAAIKGRRFIELGAGCCGLPGIVASRLGFSEVTVTDLPLCLEKLAANVQLNCREEDVELDLPSGHPPGGTPPAEDEVPGGAPGGGGPLEEKDPVGTPAGDSPTEEERPGGNGPVEEEMPGGSGPREEEMPAASGPPMPGGSGPREEEMPAGSGPPKEEMPGGGGPREEEMPGGNGTPTTTPPAKPVVRVSELDWGARLAGSQLQPPFDFIFAADCCYHVDMVDPLLDMMDLLSDSQSQIWMAHFSRSDSASAALWERLPLRFNCRQIPGMLIGVDEDEDKLNGAFMLTKREVL